MKIESTLINSSFLKQTGQMGLFSNIVSNTINKQIAKLEERLQSIDNNTAISSEKRIETKKQLSAQMESLQKLLTDKQTEMETKNKSNESSKNKNSTETISEQESGLSIISTDQILAMIDADGDFSQVQSDRSIQTSLKGKSQILENEIKLDSARGLDVTKKQEQLTDLQSNIQNASEQIAGASNASLSETSRSDTVSATSNTKTEENAILSSGALHHLDIIV